MKLFTDEQIKNGEADDYEPVILAPEEGVSYRVTSDNFEELLLKSAEQAVEIARVLQENEELKERIEELESDLDMCKEVVQYYAEEETIQLDYKHNGDFEFITNDGHYSLWESGQFAREVRDILDKK